MNTKDYLQKQAAFVNDYINKFIPEGLPKELFESIKYSLNAGGKRLRPILVLETAKAVGNENVENFIDIAIATEFVHTYSLIHDDLPAMDNDDLRRGKPTNHIVFGEAIAILAGDGLQSYAFELISKNKNIPPERLLKIVNVLSHGTGIYGMVAGQAADILHEKYGTFDDIEFIHKYKTAKFIEACCQIGAILGNASKSEEQSLKNYGLHIGMAFQIQDDILDEIGDVEKLGKKVKKDVSNNKLTFPSVFGLEKSKKLAKEHIAIAIENLKNIPDNKILINLARFIIEREV